jgi:hypothetical protein
LHGNKLNTNAFKQVPLGNFELDWLLFTADVFFSRALRDQQQVCSILVMEVGFYFV